MNWCFECDVEYERALEYFCMTCGEAFCSANCLNDHIKRMKEEYNNETD